jgi:hypothetical protein
LFGILFLNNKNLRRILTDYGFQGHPFKKNYPLTGEFDLYYNYNINILNIEKDALFQEFRLLTTSNNIGALSRIQYNPISIDHQLLQIVEILIIKKI